MSGCRAFLTDAGGYGSRVSPLARLARDDLPASPDQAAGQKNLCALFRARLDLVVVGRATLS